eukprot:5529912-Amphidinium_carterae.1
MIHCGPERHPRRPFMRGGCVVVSCEGFPPTCSPTACSQLGVVSIRLACKACANAVRSKT